MDFFYAILWEILWSTGSNGILSCGGRPPRACGLRPARRNGRLCNSTRLCSVFYEVVQKDIAFGLWSCPTHPEANGPELPLTYTDFSAHIHQSNLQKSSACPTAPTFPISSLNHPPPTFLLSRSQLRTRPMIYSPIPIVLSLQSRPLQLPTHTLILHTHGLLQTPRFSYRIRHPYSNHLLRELVTLDRLEGLHSMFPISQALLQYLDMIQTAHQCSIRRHPPFQPDHQSNLPPWHYGTTSLRNQTVFLR